MPVFSYAISDDPSRPDIAIGFVTAPCAASAVELLGDPRANVYALPEGAQAGTMGEALELADHPDAVAIERQKVWLGPGGVAVFWSN